MQVLVSCFKQFRFWHKAGLLQIFLCYLQQAAVGSLLRIEAFLSNNSLLRKKWSPWSKTWSISWHLHSRIGKNCSYNRAATHIKISCLPRESSLNRSWPWWILPQPIKDIYIFKSHLYLLSLTMLEWPQRRRRKRASNFHVHSEDAHFTGVPDNTNSPGSQEPRISKTESTAHVSDLTSDKFCRFRPIVQNSVLPRYGSPAINLENQDLHTFRDFFDSQQTDSTQDGTEITTCWDWYM